MLSRFLKTTKAPKHENMAARPAHGYSGTTKGGEGSWPFWLLIVLVSNVTAPLSANSLPSTVTPVVAVIDAYARMVPAKVELVPSVAELPTAQTTLQGWTPLM